MNPHRFFWAWIVVLGWGGVSCGSPTSGTVDTAATTDNRVLTQGIIIASYSRFLSPDYDTSGKFEFYAMFPRFHRTERGQVDTLMGNHVPRSLLALDTCQPPDPIVTRRHKWPDRPQSVTLLDAGNMFIDQDDAESRGNIPVFTRTFPDLLKVIDGVIYSGTPAPSITFVPGATHTITTTGTDEIGPFEVLLDAPDSLGDIHVNGTSPAHSTPTITRGDPIVIDWAGGTQGDEMIVGIQWMASGISWSVECRLRDDGHHVISGDTTAPLSENGDTTDPEMTISRVREIAFAARGLSHGAFSFVTSTTFLLNFDETI